MVTTPQQPTASRPPVRRLSEEDAATLVIIRATLDERPAPPFDLYDHICRVLDGRERG